MLGTVVVALAVVSSGPAFAAASPSQLPQAQWQDQIANLPTPGGGCYHASYPVLQWQATPCVVAPPVPVAPQLPTGGGPAVTPTRGGPATIGNGADYSAQVTGTTSKATGTFKGVSRGITEAGQIGGVGGQVTDAFTLQLNTQFFTDPPACSGAAVPSQCEGWQQFIYAFHYSGTTNEVFMQYWLLYYDNTCPGGWFTYNTGGYTFCYTNSPATTYGALPTNTLGHTTFVGQAASGGNDTVSLTSPSGASSVSNSDSKLDLSAFWNTTEWGVFGDAGGAQANFGAKATLEPVTTLQGTSSSAPTCLSQGFTGETNNLSFTTTKALGHKPFPTMATKQTDKTPKTPSCQVAS
jgi:hypothetical protein